MWGAFGDWVSHKYTAVCIIASGNQLYSAGSSAQHSRRVDGWDEWAGGSSGREVQEGGDIHIYIVDSLCCTTELTQRCKVIILQWGGEKESHQILGEEIHM